MNKETLRMQMLSGIITESEYKAKLEENEQKYKVIFINGVDEEDTRTIEVTATDKEDAQRKADRILHSDEYENKNGLFSYGTAKISIIKESLNENFVGMGMVGNIFDREKTDYEIAFEHFTKDTSLNEIEVEEGNLGHNETASLEQEGRFWIVSWRGMNGPNEKVFTDEDEARAFMGSLNLEEGKDL